jgi:C1A family cysteine protease
MERRTGARLASQEEKEKSVFERDFAKSVSGLRIALPESFDLRPQLTPIRDQGSTSQCVAYAAAAMKEYQERRENQLNTNFSPQFIYTLRSNPDDGMTIPNAMTILKQYGCPFDASFPRGAKTITSKVYEEARNFRISSHSYINSPEGLKQALIEQGPVIILLKCYNNQSNFWQGSGDYDSNHAVAIVGYDDAEARYLIRNSWGTSWGKKGYGYFPYGDWDQILELWTSIDDRSNPVAQPPPPKKEESGCSCTLF